MKKLIFLLLLSSSAWAQQITSKNDNYNDFKLIVKVEDQEKYYNKLVQENPVDRAKPETYNQYRADLAINWLAKGNIERFKHYMNTDPKFTQLHLMNITYALEDLVDNGKHIKVVEQISRDLLDKLEKGVLTDYVSRTQVIMEVNAFANAKLGNIELAMKNIVKSGTVKNSARASNYFQDSKAKYYTRYSLILAASGEPKKALDTLTKALRNADSNPKLVSAYKEIYKEVNGSIKGADKEIKMLQDEAYHHYYKELENSYITTTDTREGFLPPTKKNGKPFQIFSKKLPFDEIELPDLTGKMVKFADYKGKVLVIDFWSTVCTPCMAAFAGFEKVVAEYKNDPFQLFIIDLYEPSNTVKSLVAKKDVKLDVLHDEADKSFSIQATPTKIVFDPMGVIRFYSAGYAGSTDREYYKLKAMVEIVKARSSGMLGKI